MFGTRLPLSSYFWFLCGVLVGLVQKREASKPSRRSKRMAPPRFCDHTLRMSSHDYRPSSS